MQATLKKNYLPPTLTPCQLPQDLWEEHMSGPHATGGKACFVCPYFRGEAPRTDKGCSTCPYRMFSISRTEQTSTPTSMMEQRSSWFGVIEPSDGHPQEEMTPDFGWFRPLSYNVPTWVLYWPELEV
ncbi:MAG: hypothetical protein JO126_04370 [Alphaproteobacteria bacterium]|nr:hypothetical protein [Alphaproteobacteria bacterium]MBV8548672.1 hypothetical protein [Alphaproteobacteria bacterium]